MTPEPFPIDELWKETYKHVKEDMKENLKKCYEVVNVNDIEYMYGYRYMHRQIRHSNKIF